MIITGSLSTSATVVSNAALPLPTIIAAQEGDGNPTRGEPLAGFMPTTEVSGRVRRLVTKSAEVDDLPHAGLFAGSSHVVCRLSISTLEVV